MVLEKHLDWDDTFGIVQGLIKNHPQVNFEELSLRTLFNWIISLPEFDDDPSLANDDILIQIFATWYE
ncbi:MAG: Fe-S cluster assembly protein IscX, partial [Anaerolineales bacterium]|nr:Fe-S cluster assembly protein IscX [Anaerolineales bacterium]